MLGKVEFCPVVSRMIVSVIVIGVLPIDGRFLLFMADFFGEEIDRLLGNVVA
jgi:hypothetical protein